MGNREWGEAKSKGKSPFIILHSFFCLSPLPAPQRVHPVGAKVLIGRLGRLKFVITACAFDPRLSTQFPIIDGTCLQASGAAPLGLQLRRSLPRSFCTRLLPQGLPFGSTFGRYNSTFPRSCFTSLVHHFSFFIFLSHLPLFLSLLFSR